MFKTHMAFAVVVSLFMYNFFHETNFVVFTLLVMLGAMLPDIDNKRSKISQKAKVISSLINVLTKHRGIFHSVFIPLGIYFFLEALGFGIYGIPIALGYLSHILIDALTPLGVNFLHPVTTLHLHGPVETNSWIEKILLASFIMLIIILLL